MLLNGLKQLLKPGSSSKYTSEMEMLKGMGFLEDHCKIALEMTSGNIEQAVNYITTKSAETLTMIANNKDNDTETVKTDTTEEKKKEESDQLSENEKKAREIQKQIKKENLEKKKKR